MLRNNVKMTELLVLSPSYLSRQHFGNLENPRECAIHELPSQMTNLVGLEYEKNALHMFRKLGLARGRDSYWRPKGSRPLGTNMLANVFSWCQASCNPFLGYEFVFSLPLVLKRSINVHFAMVWK